jgi:hypothetical protein
VHAGLVGGAAHRFRCQQRLQVISPFFAQAQACQRRGGQVVEGAAAVAATIALQVVGVAMPLPVHALAAWAATISRPGLLDECDDVRQAGRRPQRVQHLQALRLV